MPDSIRAVNSQYEHIPVLLKEVIQALQPRPGGTFIDATVGLAGHASRILEGSSPNGRLLGIDTDRDALAAAAQRLEAFGERFVPAAANFSELQRIAEKNGFLQVDGILMDLGV